MSFYKLAKSSNLNMKSEMKNSKKVNPSFIIPEFLIVMVTHTNQSTLSGGGGGGGGGLSGPDDQTHTCQSEPLIL